MSYINLYNISLKKNFIKYIILYINYVENRLKKTIDNKKNILNIMSTNDEFNNFKNQVLNGEFNIKVNINNIIDKYIYGDEQKDYLKLNIKKFIIKLNKSFK